jgi:N-acetylglucosamine repressor
MNTTPLRSNDIRERNEKLILNLMHSRKILSQSQAAALTGLKPPTVFRIFTELERQGVVRISGEKVDSADRKGRKPVFYSVEPTAFYLIGIDFWALSAAIVIADFSGTVIYQKTEGFGKPLTADELVDRLRALIQESIEARSIPLEKVLGVGIGAPGRVDIESGTIVYYSRIDGMRNFPLRERMKSIISVPVFLHNNCSVLSMSELRYGKAKDVSSMLTVLIRSGVGGSFINDGKLLVIRDRTALELGHVCMVPDGALCSCGRRGCLESYLSEDAICASMPPELEIDSIAKLDETLKSPSDAVLDVLRDKARLLAMLLRNLYQIFCPQCFLIVSRSVRLSRYLADFGGEYVRSIFANAEGLQADILADGYDPVMAGRGAIDLIFDRYFSV